MHQVPNENVNFIYTVLTRLHIEVCQMNKLEYQWCKAHHPGFFYKGIQGQDEREWL